MKRRAVIPAVLISVLFAGCGSSPQTVEASDAAADASTGPTVIAPIVQDDETEESAPTSTGEVDAPDMNSLVAFGVSGGLLGRDDMLLLSADGEVEVTSGQGSLAASIDESEVIEIEELLEASGLFDRSREYLGEGADIQTYTIRYAGVTIVADDASLPAELVPAVERLDALMRP